MACRRLLSAPQMMQDHETHQLPAQCSVKIPMNRSRLPKIAR